VFNRRTLCVEEYVHVVCDETNSLVQENALEDEDVKHYMMSIGCWLCMKN